MAEKRHEQFLRRVAKYNSAIADIVGSEGVPVVIKKAPDLISPLEVLEEHLVAVGYPFTVNIVSSPFALMGTYEFRDRETDEVRSHYPVPVTFSVDLQRSYLSKRDLDIFMEAIKAVLKELGDAWRVPMGSAEFRYPLWQ